MTAPDAPTAMTLEEATALHGLTFVRNLDDSAWVAGRIRFLSPHDHSKYAHSWEPLGVGATWAEAASQALGYPVVERDPTAELVEALRSATFLARTYYEHYITEAKWDHEFEDKWPEELREDREAINHAAEVLVRHSAALARHRGEP